MKPIFHHSPFFIWTDICQINYGILSCWILLNPALMTARKNSSVSAHGNRNQSSIIFDIYTYFFLSYFISFLFLLYYLLKNWKILSRTRGNQWKGGMSFSSGQCFQGFWRTQGLDPVLLQHWKELKLKTVSPGSGPKALCTNNSVVLPHFHTSDLFWEGLRPYFNKVS